MNTHKNKNHSNRKIVKYDREFLGIIITPDNYAEILKRGGRDEINFHNKHLRAYKQGKVTFTHGVRVNEEGEKLGPMFHQVQVKLNLVE